MDLKKFNFLQLPNDQHLETWIENRHARNVMYNLDLESFFDNAKKLNVKDIYFWMNSQNSETFYDMLQQLTNNK